MDSHKGLHILLSTIEQTYLPTAIHNSIMAIHDMFHMCDNIIPPPKKKKK